MKNIMLILLPALLLLCFTPLLNAQSRLRRFNFINVQFTLDDARSICTRNYTDLATIYNQDENTAATIKCLTTSGYPSCWIGLNRCSWSNSDLVTYNNIPGTFSMERCCGAVKPDRTWNCTDCESTQMYFMCYKKDDHLQSFNYTLIRENKTWSDAQRYCRDNHTDLVSITNQTQNDQVTEVSNGSFPFWIGLQYNYSSSWFDGGQSDYKASSISKDGCFTYISGGYWSKSNSDQKPALCYKSFINVSESIMSWDEAMDYCNDSRVLVIQSDSDQNDTENELRRRNISGPVWVGLRQSRLFGFWIWTNGLQLGPWTNWTGGSAPEYQMSQHCGALVEENGRYKLTDRDCRQHFRVVCETDY